MLRSDSAKLRMPLRWGRSRRGFALVSTLLLLFLLVTIVTIAMMVSGLQARVSRNLQAGLQATYLAEAAIQHALYQLRLDTSWRTGIGDTVFGPGTYRLTASQPVPGGDIDLVATGNVDGAERTITNRLRTLLMIEAGTGSAGYNGDGLQATAARLDFPEGIYIDAVGNLFVADRDNHRIRRVDAATGTISTVAGTGNAGYNGDGILATTARLNFPIWVCGDASGNLFIADFLNHRIRRVDAATGTISTVAGTGSQGYNGDGILATLARLNLPTGVHVDASGNLFIADLGNDRVRRVDGLTGLISTVAGTGTGGYNGDGILATTAELDTPAGLYVDASDNLFVADFGNHRIRRVDAATGLISTVAGVGTAGDGGDAGVPTATSLRSPAGVFVDVAGNVYFSDFGNHRVRRTRLRSVRWEGT